VRRSHLQLVQEVAPELGINGYALLETLAVQPERRQSDPDLSAGWSVRVVS
jgi:hypothetical protein